MMLATDAPKTTRQWTGSPTFDFRPSDFRLLHKKNRRNPVGCGGGNGSKP
jgi:hypothetical protein